MNDTIVSSQILKSLSNATTELIDRVAPSVVSLICGMGRGSGVVWNKDGYIVTCNHVVAKQDIVKVGLGEDRMLPAEVVGQDPYSDVALLRTEKTELQPIELGDSEILKTGQLVLALANPFNQQPSATVGIVTSVGSSLRRWGGMPMEDIIVTDAKLNPGYSGGPLVDVSGKMIGLNTAYVWSRGIAVPTSIVKSVVSRLLNGHKIKRAYLGITSGTITLPDEVAILGEISQDRGVMILSVENGSPARKAGLALGDIIIRFNEKRVTDVYDLPKLLTEDVIGKRTEISILRGEKLIEFTISPSAAGSDIDE